MCFFFMVEANFLRFSHMAEFVYNSHWISSCLLCVFLFILLSKGLAVLSLTSSEKQFYLEIIS